MTMMFFCRSWRRLRHLMLLCAFSGSALSQVPAAADQPLHALPYAPVLDLASMDPSVAACEDFYRFSCGGWQRNNPIPPDQPGWDVYAKMLDQSRRFLWGLLIEAGEDKPGRSVPAQKAGDYFAACMDERAVEAAGARPLAPLLARIDALRRREEIGPLLAELHSAGADSALWHFGSEQDRADSTRVIGVADAGGLGLPDREQYLARDASSRALRAAYLAHIARLLQLLGDAPALAHEEARTVLALETELARASLSREQRRDPHRIYHRMSAARLQALSPAFDWAGYLQSAGVNAATPINVAEPAFFRRVNALLRQRPLAEWKTYLRWHLVNSHAPYLSEPYARAVFDFYSATLEGVQAMPARWKRCVRWVDRDLGEALGQLYVDKSFTPSHRERASSMARAIEEAMQQRLRALDWMSERTQQAALAKLKTLVNKFGYPERWRDYGALVIARDDFHGNVTRSQAFEWRRQLAKIGRPVDRDEWDMTPPTINAYYDPQLNAMNFPAGVLQPPLFDPAMDDAPNFGNTGATIGHELTHAFDDEGRQYDARGNLRDWWTRRDAAEFNRRAGCVVDQYSAYTVVDDIKINGRLTLGEDVADLGGTLLAHMAWQAHTAGQVLASRDGFTPEQRFFIGMAQWACSNQRPQRLRLLALTDPHSPSRFRVNGVVSNMPEFARAFSCRPGQPMVRPKPCKVW